MVNRNVSFLFESPRQLQEILFIKLLYELFACHRWLGHRRTKANFRNSVSNSIVPNMVCVGFLLTLSHSMRAHRLWYLLLLWIGFLPPGNEISVGIYATRHKKCNGWLLGPEGGGVAYYRRVNYDPKQFTLFSVEEERARQRSNKWLLREEHNSNQTTIHRWSR